MSTGLRNRKRSKLGGEGAGEADMGGGGLVDAINGAKTFMGRTITFLKIIVIICIAYNIIRMSSFVKKKIGVVKREWNEGWSRHDEAMIEMKQRLDKRWMKHNAAIGHVQNEVREQLERNQETMEKLGELMLHLFHPGKKGTSS